MVLSFEFTYQIQVCILSCIIMFLFLSVLFSQDFLGQTPFFLSVLLAILSEYLLELPQLVELCVLLNIRPDNIEY